MNHEPWDEFCEDGDCDDPVHPTLEELIARATTETAEEEDGNA